AQQLRLGGDEGEIFLTREKLARTHDPVVVLERDDFDVVPVRWIIRGDTFDDATTGTEDEPGTVGRHGHHGHDLVAFVELDELTHVQTGGQGWFVVGLVREYGKFHGRDADHPAQVRDQADVGT